MNKPTSYQYDLKALNQFKIDLQAEYNETEPGTLSQDMVSQELQMLEDDIAMTEESINLQQQWGPRAMKAHNKGYGMGNFWPMQFFWKNKYFKML